MPRPCQVSGLAFAKLEVWQPQRHPVMVLPHLT
jgi:hypothetical protein